MGFVERLLHQVSDAGRLVGEVVLGGLVLLMVVDVTLRYVFNQPFGWVLEVVEIALCVVVFFSLCLCTARQGHVDIPILFMRLPHQVQAAINILVCFLGTGLFCVVAWRMCVYAIYTHRIGLVTPILRLPLYPFFFVLTFCSLIVTLLLLSQSVYYIKKAISQWTSGS